MISEMQLVQKPLNIPAFNVYRQDQQTTATLFQVDLLQDARLTPVNFAPGELINVRMTQDSVGGHVVNWVGTFEGDTTLLVPDPTPGASSFVVFIARTATVLEIIAGGRGTVPSGGGGTIFVPDWASLLLVDGGPLSTGQKVFVGNNTAQSSIKDFVILDKTSAAAASFLTVGVAIGGGRWLRTLEPDPTAILRTDYYVDSAPATTRTTARSQLPSRDLEEWKRRVCQTWTIFQTSMTVHLLADDPAGLTFDESWLAGLGSVTIDGSLGGTKVLNNAAITAVTTASNAGVGGTDGTITIVGDFAASEKRIGIINAGPRAGARFVVHDLGGGVARVGNVSAGQFDNTGTTLQIGDTFDTWTWPDLGPNLEVIGTQSFFGLLFLTSVRISASQVDFFNSSLLLDSVVFADEPFSDSASFVEYFNCSFARGQQSNGGAETYLLGGMSFGTVNTLLATTYYGNFTMQGAQMVLGDGLGLKATEANSWIASFNCRTPTTLCPDGSRFRWGSGSHHWGQDCDGPRIEVQGGGSYRYANVPNIIGAGAVDALLVDQNLVWTDLPASHLDSGGVIAPNTSPGDVLLFYKGYFALGTAEKSVPLVSNVGSAGHVGAQNIAIGTTNAVELSGALTADVAITWTQTPDLDTPVHAQDWVFKYLPAGNHATFPTTAFPTTPAALNDAALAAAETGGATSVTMWFHCDSAGRVSCTWVAE